MADETMDLKGGLKESKIGPMPEDWQVVPLGHVVDSITDCLHDRKPARKQKGKTLLHVYNIAQYGDLDLSNLYLISEEDFVNWSRRVKPREGDIVISKVGRVGAIAHFDKDLECAIGRNLVVIRPDRGMVDSLYLKHLMLSTLFRSEVKRLTHTGSIHKSLHVKQIPNLQIPLPLLFEQRRIAKVLSTIQQAIQQQDNIVDAARELKKSLMRHLFTYGPVSVVEAERVSLRDTEIGHMPTHWDVVPLKNVTRETERRDPREDSTRRFTYIDVSAVSNRDYQIAAPKEYAGSDAPSRARKLVKAGDIIFATVRPYLKRIAMIPQSLDGQVCSTAFCVIRCKTNVADPVFVFNFLVRNSFVDRVSELQSGSSYPAVTDKQVLDQKIPVPPLTEQREIARILSTVDGKIEVEEQRKALLQELLKTMLHKLITGQIRVKELEV